MLPLHAKGLCEPTPNGRQQNTLRDYTALPRQRIAIRGLLAESGQPPESKFRQPKASRLAQSPLDSQSEGRRTGKKGMRAPDKRLRRESSLGHARSGGRADSLLKAAVDRGSVRTSLV